MINIYKVNLIYLDPRQRISLICKGEKRIRNLKDNDYYLLLRHFGKRIVRNFKMCVCFIIVNEKYIFLRETQNAKETLCFVLRKDTFSIGNNKMNPKMNRLKINAERECEDEKNMKYEIV